MSDTKIEHHKVVSESEWVAARTELLLKEKEFTRLRDDLSRQRRELPWVRVDKAYAFDGPTGKVTLADLFKGKSQLVVYHFMFAPDWSEGCKGCSFHMDHVDGMLPHIAQRDVAFVTISRAPLSKIEAFKKRMGWHVDWVSSADSDFNYDYQATFRQDSTSGESVYYNYTMQTFPDRDAPGLSVFYKDGSGTVYHTYSTYARGLDILLGTYNYLDLVPKGRDEHGPTGGEGWIRHHDRYPDAQLAGLTRSQRPAANPEATQSAR
jgi:predicted dithiol-disulfide oxidoreductase (DUF899 family)